jgi:hypothetical protein
MGFLSGKINMAMDKDALFKGLKRQNKAVLLDLLQSAYDDMNSQQRRYVFSGMVEQLKPLKLIVKDVIQESKKFYRDSLSGLYYAPFNVNSKNFSDIPEETQEWFDTLGDLLKESTQLTKQGEHGAAVESFYILYELIERMASGEDIVFADECGTWMIPGSQSEFLDAYISSLAEVKVPEEYTEIVLLLMKRNRYSSFCKNVYSLAIKYANKDQAKHLKAAVKEQNIETKSSR